MIIKAMMHVCILPTAARAIHHGAIFSKLFVLIHC